MGSTALKERPRVAVSRVATSMGPWRPVLLREAWVETTAETPVPESAQFFLLRFSPRTRINSAKMVAHSLPTAAAVVLLTVMDLRWAILRAHLGRAESLPKQLPRHHWKDFRSRMTRLDRAARSRRWWWTGTERTAAVAVAQGSSMYNEILPFSSKEIRPISEWEGAAGGGPEAPGAEVRAVALRSGWS